MEQALKLLTFRPVAPFVSGAAASWSPGHGCPPRGRPLRSWARAPAGRGSSSQGWPGASVIRKSANTPRKTLPRILRCQHQGHSDPHRAQLGRLPSQEQEEGWQPLSTRNKALGETAEARFLTFLIFPRQRPRGSSWIRQQRTNSRLPWRLSFSPIHLPCNWMPPNTSILLKPNPRSPLPPPSASPRPLPAPPQQRLHQPTCYSSQRPGGCLGRGSPLHLAQTHCLTSLAHATS